MNIRNLSLFLLLSSGAISTIEAIGPASQLPAKPVVSINESAIMGYNESGTINSHECNDLIRQLNELCNRNATNGTAHITCYSLTSCSSCCGPSCVQDKSLQRDWDLYNMRVEKFYKKIKDIARDIAKKYGACIIIPSGSDYCVEPAYDITDEVIIVLNKGYDAV